jgi:hypothetical protein
MAKAADSTRKAPDRRERRDPDHDLAHRVGVANRYVLRLREPRDAAIVLRVLTEVSIPLGYLLLLPSGSHDQLVAYVGLGAHDVADLPIRFASQGIQVERGEELEDRTQRCISASTDAPLRRQGSPRRPSPKAGAPHTKRRPA